MKTVRNDSTTTQARFPLHPPGGDAFLTPDFVESFNAWLAVSAENAQSWQVEMMDFVARRMESDRQAWLKFAQCRTPVEFGQVQQAWFGEALQSYLDESRRLAGMAMEPEPTPDATRAPKPSKAVG